MHIKNRRDKKHMSKRNVCKRENNIYKKKKLHIVANSDDEHISGGLKTVSMYIIAFQVSNSMFIKRQINGS